MKDFQLYLEQSKKAMEQIKKKEIETLQYNLYLLECKYKNVDIMIKIIKKYCKKEYCYYVFDRYMNNDLSEIEDAFILKSEFLKDKYNKYKYIFINVKSNKKDFIFFYKK